MTSSTENGGDDGGPTAPAIGDAGSVVADGDAGGSAIPPGGDLSELPARAPSPIRALRDHNRRGISGAVVPVHFGLALALCGLFSSLLLAGDLVFEVGSAWCAVGFVIAAFLLGGLAAWYGVYGVIRYGLFTEGCGAEEVARELRLSRFAYAAGGVAQATLLLTAVLTIALFVKLAL